MEIDKECDKNRKGSDEETQRCQEEDKLSEAIGVGRWQVFLFVMLSVPIKMTAVWGLMGIIFLAPKTTFRCVETNMTAQIVNSTCYSDCVQYEYYSMFDNTIISQWGLICERAWMANFTQTVFMFGVLIGSMVFGFWADRYGRRPTLLAACMLQLVSSLATPFCPSYWIYTSVRFFFGASTAGTMVVAFVILMEIIGPSKRELMNSVFHLPIALGEVIMPAFAYYLRSWNLFSLGVAIPNAVFLVYFFTLPESPKWLISMGKLQEASRVMTMAAKCNKLPSENMLYIAESIVAESRKVFTQETEKKATYADLITIPSLRRKNICSCVCWFVLGLSFYGGIQYIGQTSSNAYITMALAGVVQMPGMLSSGYFCKRYGRRSTTIWCFVIAAVCNAVLAVPDHYFYVKLIAGSCAACFGTVAFSSMYMFTSELFPTVARNMAVGASSTASRLGSMLAPFVAGLSTQGNWIPPVVFSVVPLVAAVVCRFLPETRGKILTDWLERD